MSRQQIVGGFNKGPLKGGWGWGNVGPMAPGSLVGHSLLRLGSPSVCWGALEGGMLLPPGSQRLHRWPLEKPGGCEFGPKRQAFSKIGPAKHRWTQPTGRYSAL